LIHFPTFGFDVDFVLNLFELGTVLYTIGVPMQAPNNKTLMQKTVPCIAFGGLQESQNLSEQVE